MPIAMPVSVVGVFEEDEAPITSSEPDTKHFVVLDRLILIIFLCDFLKSDFTLHRSEAKIEEAVKTDRRCSLFQCAGTGQSLLFFSLFKIPKSASHIFWAIGYSLLHAHVFLLTTHVSRA